MSKQKKVMYFISSNYHGIGGHYYSVRTTAEELSGVIEPCIVVIGRTKSPVIELTSVKHFHVFGNGWKTVITIWNLAKLIKKEKPDVIHGFDWGVLLYARILGFLFKIPYVNTLPGGGNPTVFYPYVKNLILFSQENYNYFKSNKKFKESNLFLIPNRITPLKSDEKRIDVLKKEIDLLKKTFLRISRFALHYKESLIQSINLIKYLHEQDIDSQLILIGTIAEKDIYDDIIEYIKSNNIKNIHIFTEHYFTVNASELIDIADFVVGTGRGFMEACSRGKVMFSPIKDSKFPVLINKTNFMGYFNTNFSPRNVLNEEGMANNLNDIVSLVESEGEIKIAKKYSKLVFEKYFDINQAKGKYKEIYMNLQYDKENHLFEFIEHFLRQFKSAIQR